MYSKFILFIAFVQFIQSCRSTMEDLNSGEIEPSDAITKAEFVSRLKGNRLKFSVLNFSMNIFEIKFYSDEFGLVGIEKVNDTLHEYITVKGSQVASVEIGRLIYYEYFQKPIRVDDHLLHNNEYSFHNFKNWDKLFLNIENHYGVKFDSVQKESLIIYLGQF